jgi:hypothetical protein
MAARKKIHLASVAAIGAALQKLVRIEPTCIKCGCTYYEPCDEGCGWAFLNKRTNEGICTACVPAIAKKAGYY